MDRRLHCVAAAVAVSAMWACEGPGVGKAAFVGATLWDGTGAPPVLDAVVIVDGNHIESAGPPDAVEVPRGADVHRVDGQWIIPGLIDAHAHTERWMLRPFLAHGVTTVRDLGADMDSITLLRDSLSLVAMLGPRLFMSGAAIDGPRATSPTAQAVRTPVQARRAIDERVLMNVTHASISTKMTRPLLRALLHEAKTLRLPVAADLGRIDALTAAREGISTIEHMSGVVEATVADPRPYFRAHADFFTGWSMSLRGWLTLDSAALDRTASSLAEAGVAMVPTLIYLEAFSHLRDRAFVNSLDLSAVPPEISQRWAIPSLISRAGINSTDFAAFQRARRVQDLFLRRFKAAGGIVAAGTNTPHPLIAPGASLHEELRLLVHAGLTPREALLAATRDAARVLGTDTLGVIRAGGVADFLVLAGNPLDDIGRTKAITLVVFRGTVYHPEDFPP